MIGNPNLDPTYLTYITSPYTTGTVLSVISTTSFQANDFLVIGQPTEEKTESKQLSSVASNISMNLASALNFSHPQDAPVYKTIWDQVSIESNTGTGWNVLTTSALQWDNPDNITVYYDQNGTNATLYRFHYYNSSTGLYSDYSPTITGAVPTKQSVSYMVDNVRKIVNDPTGRIVSTDEIIRDFNEAQDIIYATRRDWWFLKFEDSTITSLAGQKQYNLDFLGNGSSLDPGIELGYIDTIRYNLNDGSQNIIYQLEHKPYIEYDNIVKDNNRAQSNNVLFYTLLPADANSTNGYFVVEPIPSSAVGTFYIRAWKVIPVLQDLSDNTLIPVPSLLENFAIAKAFRVLGNEQKAAVYEELFYGPAPAAERSQKLTGIPLLENINMAQLRPRGQAQSIWKYRGRHRFFGDNFLDRDAYIEQHLGD